MGISRRAAVAVLCVIAAGQAAAQAAWPAKPITLVVPFAAGGPTDVVARTLGASMGRTLGQTVVIENKPEGLQGWLKAEIDKWGPIIRATGTYAD